MLRAILKEVRAMYANDTNGNETLHATYGWNVGSNSWTTSYKTESEFDGNNNKIVEKTAFSGGADSWLYNQMHEMAYDGLNRMVSDYTSRWDSSASDWTENGLVERTYWGDSDKKTTETNSDWNGLDYTPSFRFSYEYDDSGNLLTEMTSIWLGEEWFDGLKIEFGGYNEYGDYETKVEYEFDDMTLMDWKATNESAFEYTYDERGNMLTSIETQSSIYSSYITKYKFEFAFDNFDNMTSYARYDWNIPSEVWVGTFKFDYVYNDDNLWVDFFAYSWDAGVWEAFRRSEITYDENKCIATENECFWIDEDWFCNLFNTYYWSEFVPTSIEAVVKENIKVYSHDKNIVVMNNIKGEDIRVYDMRGSLQKTITRANSIENIPATTGIYIVQVSNYAAKVVVR